MSEKYPDKEKIEESTFKQSEEPKVKKKKKYQITFKENRSYEMKIWHEKFRFEPRGQEGDSQVLTKAQIESSDFESCKKRFSIKEL